MRTTNSMAFTCPKKILSQVSKVRWIYALHFTHLISHAQYLALLIPAIKSWNSSVIVFPWTETISLCTFVQFSRFRVGYSHCTLNRWSASVHLWSRRCRFANARWWTAVRTRIQCVQKKNSDYLNLVIFGVLEVRTVKTQVLVKIRQQKSEYQKKIGLEVGSNIFDLVVLKLVKSQVLEIVHFLYRLNLFSFPDLYWTLCMLCFGNIALHPGIDSIMYKQVNTIVSPPKNTRITMLSISMMLMS